MNNQMIDKLAIATIRSLCIDMTNKPKSGHPGICLGAAPIVYTLYKYHLVSDPTHPTWINRDRFLLSCGHASALLYAMLHISGFALKMDDLKAFRTINSLTTGHPEYLHTPGVDNTSGPLGQGLAQAIGVAMSEVKIANSYKNGKTLMNHYTYCLISDGDLEEGVSQEAISLAGLHQLNKLICIYDSNNITLDGPLNLSFNENTKARFLASHWNVITVNDGNNISLINEAVKKAKLSQNKPTLIIVKTIIGYGSKNEGTNKTHGAPLGEEDGNYAKKSYNFNFPPFSVPKEIYQTLKDSFIKRGQKTYQTYLTKLNQYKKKYPKDYEIFNDAINLNLNKYIKDNVKFDTNLSEATRRTSGALINKFASEIPFLISCSADVASSVMTKIKTSEDFSINHRAGSNVNCGVREFITASIQNGMLLHGGLRPLIGSFLVFSDYMKGAIRMSALSHLSAIYVFSHDSIYVGEDGPTHQPIEHVAMLRSIPNVIVYRPCDANETYGAWRLALNSKTTPTCLILSRQNLPLVKGSDASKVKDGAYIILKEKKKSFITIIATGSEVALALEAINSMKQNDDIRLVSMPSMERFNQLSEQKQKEILGSSYNKRIAIEALSSFGWHKYAPNVLSVDQFGLSGNGAIIGKMYGFNKENVINLIKKVRKIHG